MCKVGLSSPKMSLHGILFVSSDYRYFLGVKMVVYHDAIKLLLINVELLKLKLEMVNLIAIDNTG